jgi:hypothetical protein
MHAITLTESGRRISSVGLALALVAASASAQLVARDVSAPPSDILSGRVRLPDPASTAVRSSASALPVRFEQQPDGRFHAQFELAVEREGEWSLAVLSPAAANWRVLAAPLGGVLRPIDELATLARTIQLAGDDLPGWVIDRRELAGAPAGRWIVRIEALRASDVVDGWLFARASRAVELEAHLSSFELVRGKPVAVLARASGAEFASLEDVQLVVESSGAVRTVAMHDDGAHGDHAAGDGWYGAWLPAAAQGRIEARVEARGVTHSTLPFLRTTQLAFELSDPALELAPFASLYNSAHNREQLLLYAIPRAALPPRVLVAAEVWGQTPSGPVPLCWLAKLQTPVQEFVYWRLELGFERRWAELAGARGPLEVRNVRVQDADTFNVLATLERAPFDAPASSGHVSAPLAGQLGEPLPPDATSFPRSLLLAHGYCSSGSIWPAAHFSQPKLEFLDPNANRTHDQFAQLLAAQAASQQLYSFGVVAHSQGGAAALHLRTFYVSPLDNARGARRIQCVATPFQGTPLASFGFLACGTNSNLTTSGAAAWLANIPSWARAEVFAWTTSNSGSACNALVDFFLTNPEDGTVERTRGQLPGGNNVAHVTGWCHTTGMSNPANYTDAARNADMNTNAAR